MPKLAANFEGKYWCFTTNNPSPDDHPPNIWPDVEFCVWQHEKGDEGTEHVQGYVCFKTKHRLSWIKNNTCYRSHWEPRMGKHAEAKHYCMKPVPDCDCVHCVAAAGQRIDGPWTIGDDSRIAPGQGARSDITAVQTDIIAGATMQDIADNHFGAWCRYRNSFAVYMAMQATNKREWITRVTVLWGPPGIGKSRRARFEAGPDAYWVNQPSGENTWWDGYRGNENVVIDEFYGWMPRTLMQRLCDSTPIDVKVHGATTPFLAKRIWITSNSPPSQWWPNVGLGPMERRLTGDHGEVIHMTQPWVEPQQNVPPPPSAEELVQLINQLGDGPWSPTAEWAMHGTPDDGPAHVATADEAHDQDPLSRCPACHSVTILPELCEACIERMQVGDWNNYLS